MDKPKFVYVTYISTTPEKLWEALTDGAFTRRYWGGRRIQADWNVGAPVRLVREDGGIDWQGEVLQSERPRLLSYTFHMQISNEHRGEQPSRVTFEPSADGLRREAHFDPPGFRVEQRDLRNYTAWLAGYHVEPQEPSRDW